MKSDTNLVKIDSQTGLANITHIIESPVEPIFIDINQIKHNIKSAKNTLRRLSVTPNQSAQHLPHYLLIGLPGAGKTTLLANSAIEFFEQDKLVQKTPEGLTTVTHSNWWVSHNAVFIDVPGYYLDTPKAAGYAQNNNVWQYFLKLLRKHITIQGIIIAVDIPTLINSDHLKTSIDLLQIRLQELAKTLKYPLTIQLVFTKTDIIEGFIEFFDDLSKEERELSWGIILPPSKNLTDDFNTGFNNLLQRLNERVIHRLHQEHSTNRKSLIKNFCLQFAVLNTPLRKFIFQLNALIIYFKNLSATGVFFCSSKQSCQPEDLLLENFAKNFKLNINPTPRPLFKNQAYFVKSIFNDLLQRQFNKKSPANSWLKTTIIISLLTATPAAAILFYQSYKQQTVLIKQSNQLITEYQATFSKPLKIEAALAILDKVTATIAKINSTPYQSLYLVGSYQPNTIKNQLKLIYSNILQTELYPILKRSVEHTLVEAANLSPEETYNALKTYLMLSSKQHINIEYLINYFTNHLALNHINYSPLQLRQHLSNALSYTTSFTPGNPALIAHARHMLNNSPEHILAYMLLRNSGHSQQTNMIVETATKEVFSNSDLIQHFPEIYTKRQFVTIYNSIIPDINQLVQDNRWILGETFHFSNSAIFTNTLKKMYVSDYLEKWQQLTNTLSVVPFDSFQQALTIINILRTSASPFYSYLNLLSDNIEQTLPKDILGQQQATFVREILRNKPKILAEQPETQDRLSRLALYLNNFINNDNPDKTAFETAVTKFTTNDTNDPIHSLIDYANTSPYPLSKWLNQTAAAAWRLILKQAAAYINIHWQQQVFAFYQAKIANKYPFNRQAKEDIKADDFIHFFGPEGIVAGFYNYYLSSFIDTRPAQWQSKNIYEQHLPLQKATVINFERSYLIRKMFFNDNGIIAHKYNIELVATTPNVAAVTITTDNQTLTFSSNKTLKGTIQWAFNKQFNIAIQDQSGEKYTANYQGPWSMMHFLDNAKLAQTSDVQHYEFEYELQGHLVKFSLVTDQLFNPFIKGMLEPFNLSKQL